MMLYALYRIGYLLAMTLPIRCSYWIAGLAGNICYRLYGKERSAMRSNLKIVLGDKYSRKEETRISREIFINFAKYLADFFRFSRIDEEYIKRFIALDGVQNFGKARLAGKGLIVLSAHIGNWELGGYVLGRLLGPINAVALTHKNKRINDFFTRQRLKGSVSPIEIGMALKKCFSVLDSGGVLGLLGDRDFSKSGVYTEFFGHPALIPRGPAAFSCRFNAPIVPVFMIRQKDDTFRFFIEKPICPDRSLPSGDAVKKVMKEYTKVIESYVRRYPEQWYMFRKVWGEGER
jgi:KDO2-lipid IV(A) lauroyltransferase